MNINSHLVLNGIQIALFGGVCSVLLASKIPSLNSLLSYGKTKTGISKFEQLYIPKRCFIHFYYWHFMLSTGSVVWYFMNNYHELGDDAFVIVLLMNLVQANRRLYECLYISKWNNSSKIHITHYIAGIFFYTAINLTPILLRNLGNEPLNSKLLISLVVIAFTLVSIDQYRNHYHLASLKKYSLPTHGLFKFVLCAHYFDEIVIYFLFALLYTSLVYTLILLWVFVNLSTSANESWKWYIKKDLITQDENIKSIIPFVL